MTADDNLRNIYVQWRHLWRYIASGFEMSEFSERVTAF